jgi:hypothetical protein
MKKPLLAAAATLALAALYATPATADTFKGSCGITGVAKFDHNLKSSKDRNGYDFKSGSPASGKPDETTCTGELNGQPITNVPAYAAVKGFGNLSCAQSESTEDGIGSLQFPTTGSYFPFGFSFTGTLTEVDFKAKSGGNEIPGHASFAEFAPPDTPVKCATDGVPSLGFRASFDSGAVTLTGFNTNQPTPASGGGGAPDTTSAPTSGAAPKKSAPCSNLRGAKRTACARRAACMRKKGRKRSQCLAALNKRKPARKKR